MKRFEAGMLEQAVGTFKAITSMNHFFRRIRVTCFVNRARAFSVPALVEETPDALWVTPKGKEVMFLDRRWQRLNRVQFTWVTVTKKLAR